MYKMILSILFLISSNVLLSGIGTPQKPRRNQIAHGSSVIESNDPTSQGTGQGTKPQNEQHVSSRESKTSPQENNFALIKRLIIHAQLAISEQLR